MLNVLISKLLLRDKVRVTDKSVDTHYAAFTIPTRMRRL